MPIETNQRISVVIPTYNRADLLSRTLDGYCHQSLPCHRYEVNVVDDGSTDTTESVVSHYLKTAPYQLKFARIDHAGPAAARNRGIQLAAGDRILFTGDDIFPHRDLLQQHALAAENHPDAGILGFVEWSPDLEVDDFMRFVAPAGPQFDFSDIANPLNCGHTKFHGANISIPTSWASTERFDEKISTATLEDHEYGYRLEKRGFKIVFNARAIGYHYHPMTHSSFLARMEDAGKVVRYIWDIHPELRKTELRPLSFLPMGLLQLMLDVLSPAARLLDRRLFWKVTMMSRYLRGIRAGYSRD